MFDTHNGPFAPISGTVPQPRALFVDRFGTLLRAPERGWLEHPDEVEFLPGAREALFRAIRAGWKLYLLGNDDEVAYGDVPLTAWEAIQQRIADDLESAGVIVERSYTCTTRPDGVRGQVGDSVYLLPNTGAFYHATHTDGIELRKSWVIGDSTLELVAGWRSGCRLAAVRTGLALRDRTFEVEPELFGDDLAGVVRVLLDQAALSA